MFSGIASVLVMIYWDAAGPPSAVFFFVFLLLLLLFFFFFLFLYLLPFKRLSVDMDRQTDSVTYSEAGDEA